MVSGGGISTRFPLRTTGMCRWRSSGSTPNIADGRVDRLRDGGAAGDQTAAADTDDQRVQIRGVLQQFQCRGALPRDDQRMIVRGHQRGAGLLSITQRRSLRGRREAVVSDDVRAASRAWPPSWSGGASCGITMVAGAPTCSRRDGRRLRMIAGGERDHAARQIASGEIERIRFEAPRILKAPPRWKFSHLKNTCAPARWSRLRAKSSSGVRLRERTDAVRSLANHLGRNSANWFYRAVSNSSLRWRIQRMRS